VYKLDSFVGFIGDEQLHAQECYVVFKFKCGISYWVRQFAILWSLTGLILGVRIIF
jgi:hypothetical protein